MEKAIVCGGNCYIGGRGPFNGPIFQRVNIVVRNEYSFLLDSAGVLTEPQPHLIFVILEELTPEKKKIFDINYMLLSIFPVNYEKNVLDRSHCACIPETPSKTQFLLPSFLLAFWVRMPTFLTCISLLNVMCTSVSIKRVTKTFT